MRCTVRMIAGLFILLPLVGAGCQSVRLPAIDPTGQRIFAPYDTTLATPQCGLFDWLHGEPAFSPPAPPPVCPTPAAATPAVAATCLAEPTCAAAPSCLLTPTCASSPSCFTSPTCLTVPACVTQPTATVAPPAASQPPALPTANTTNPAGVIPPLPIAGGNQERVVLSPMRIVAPVGSEVVLLAGVAQPTGVFAPHRRIEWMLSQDSVGSLVDIAGDRHCRLHRLVQFHPPEKKSNNLAVSHTGHHSQYVTRGTDIVEDDVRVPRGQTWITLTSARAGRSFVTAYAPNADTWEDRKQTASVLWVDAAWQFPAPAVSREGEAVQLTTTVRRQSDGAPLAGWIVRYEIAGGASAYFPPSRGSLADVQTDAAGQATVTVAADPSTSGTTQIAIQVLRPADAESAAPLPVGDGGTSVSWTSSGLDVEVAGPTTSEVGAPESYRITVRNTGASTASEVELLDQLPPGLTYLNSQPPGQVVGDRVVWRLGRIPAGGYRDVVVTLRGEQPGNLTQRITARSAAASAEEDFTVQMTTQAIALTLVGPEVAAVGARVQWKVTIANRSNQRLTNLLAVDYFDDGLTHSSGAASPIKQPLGDLGPGQQLEPFGITFRADRIGQFKHRMVVSADGARSVQAEVTIRVTAAPRRPREPDPAGQPSVRILQAGPERGVVGDQVLARIQINNPGDAPLQDLTLVAQYDAKLLLPSQATGGPTHEAGQLAWKIDQLAAGETKERQILYKLLAPAAQTAHRVTVASAEVSEQAEDWTVRIDLAPAGEPAGGAPPMSLDGPSNGGDSDAPLEPQPMPPSVPGGRLKVSVVDENDPVRPGDEVNYYVTLENDRNLADQNVAVTLLVPAGMSFRKLASSGGLKVLRSSTDGRTIDITAVQEMRPRDRVRFVVVLTADQVGRHAFAISVNSQQLGRPLRAEEDTTVVASE